MATHVHLVHKINVVRMSDSMSCALIEAGKSTLELFALSTGEPSSETGSQTSAIRPDPAEVFDFLRDFLPAPSKIFRDTFFKSSLFPIVILFEISKLYGFDHVDDSYASEVILTIPEKKDPKITLPCWFARFLDCSVSSARAILDKQKNTRPFQLVPGHSAQSQESPNLSDGQMQFGTGNLQHRQNTRLTSNRPLLQEFASLATQDAGRSKNVDVVSPTRDVHQEVSFQDKLGSSSGCLEDHWKAHSVQMMFKNSRFTGDLKQSIQTTLKMYSICARHYALSSAQKADLFVHNLDGPARNFFFNAATESMTFNDIAALMLQEYNSDARQLQIKGKLENLRLKKYMEDHECTDASEGLSKIVEYIDELAPQCHPDVRSDAHKIDFLRKAVAEHRDWSQSPIQGITSNGYMFNRFVTALHEVIQNLKQIHMLTGEHSGGTSIRHTDTQDTYIQQYGRNPKWMKKNLEQTGQYKGYQGQGSAGHRSFEESEKRNGCHRCRARWKPGHRCQKGSIRAHVRNCLASGESSVHVVSELVSQMEGELEFDERHSEIHRDNDEGQNESAAHYGNSQSELEAFGSFTKSRSAAAFFAEEMDAEWYVNHLSASMQQANESQSEYCTKDFRFGDAE